MRVLQIVHGFPPLGQGGAELYAESMARGLVAGWGDTVTVLTREHDVHAAEFRVREEHREGLRVCWVNNTFRTTRQFEDTYVNERITALASALIDAARPDVAHVHHLTCLSTTIIDALARRSIPIVLTLHDYWLLCHRGQLLDTTLARCDGPGRDGCARCTGAVGGPPLAFAGARLLRLIERRLGGSFGGRMRSAATRAAHALVGERRARAMSRQRLRHMRARFRQVSLALAPSAHIRERFVRAGFDGPPIIVHGYGVACGTRRVPGGEARRPLRLGFAGALMVSKAPHLLVEAAAMLPAGLVTIEMFGAPAPYHGDHAYVRMLEACLAHPAITRHGPVAHQDMTAVFASLDALVFPSVWEETSGIGAREALAAGVPVIASRIGGIPETVRHDVNGLLFEPGSAADLATQIRRLLDEPGLLARLAAGCRTPRTFDNDLAATRQHYDQLAAASGRGRREASTGSGAARIRSVVAVVLNYGTPDLTALAVTMLGRSDLPLAQVIVVDNGDGADCGAAVAHLGGDVVVRATGDNRGFSAGCNAGIREALAGAADAVLLVNSDVLVPPSCLTRLAESMRRQPRPGIVGPVVRSRIWPARVLSAGMDYDIVTGRVRHRHAPPVDGAEVSVSGCAMLVHRAVFEQIGLLDEDYFFSFEDIAFCQQARAAGFDVGIEPGATVYHEDSGTMGRRPLRLYYAARNHLRLGAATPARSDWHKAARQCAIAGYNVAHAVKARGGGLLTRLRAVTRGIAHHLRGRYGRL